MRLEIDVQRDRRPRARREARGSGAAEAPAPTHTRSHPAPGVFSGRLPHRAAFLLKISPGFDEKGTLARYGAVDGRICLSQPTDNASAPILGFLGSAPSGGTDQVVSTAIPKLGYNQAYCFWVTLLGPWTGPHRQASLTDFTARLNDMAETRRLVRQEDIREAVTTLLGDLVTVEVAKPVCQNSIATDQVAYW
jgi:hypothetical protein